MKKIFLVVLSFALLFSMLTTIPLAEENKNLEHLVILATSDVHANLFSYSYEDSKDTKNNGLARISSYVKNVRKENKNFVLVDNGDTYQGTILSDAVYNKKDVMHPVSKAMNYLKYDSMTLGNHEFNFGMKFIEKFTKELKFPVLAANATYKNGKEFKKPYTVVNKNGIKVGILGLTNPNIERWDGDKVSELKFSGIEETAKKYVDILKNKEKVDVVLVLVHAGLEPEFDEDNGSDGVNNLLKNVNGVDAVVVGHFHTTIKGEENGVIYGGPRNSGRDVVRFDMDLEKTSDGYKIVKKSVDVIDMEKTPVDLELRKVIQAEHQYTEDFINGKTNEPQEKDALGGVFGTTDKDFQPKNEIEKLPEGFLRDTAVIDLIGTVQLEMSGADVTAVALFRDDSDIKKGPITYKDLFRIYKFDNNLYTVNVTGKELKAYMEWSAEFFNQFKEGDLTISFNPDIPGYRYDMFKGIDYKIDISKPAGQRIVDVKFKGHDLKDDEVIKLAVNNYRYSSGLKANKLVAEKKDWESNLAVRESIAKYIKEKKTITPHVSNNFELIGYSFDKDLRKKAVDMINSGEIDFDRTVPVRESDLNNPTKKVVSDKNIKSEQNELDKTSKVDKKEVKPEVKKETKVVKEKVHTVVDGEWIYKIARLYGLKGEDLLKINKLRNPNKIYPGDKILIPQK